MNGTRKDYIELGNTMQNDKKKLWLFSFTFRCDYVIWSIGSKMDHGVQKQREKDQGTINLKGEMGKIGVKF